MTEDASRTGGRKQRMGVSQSAPKSTGPALKPTRMAQGAAPEQPLEPPRSAASAPSTGNHSRTRMTSASRNGANGPVPEPAKGRRMGAPEVTPDSARREVPSSASGAETKSVGASPVGTSRLPWRWRRWRRWILFTVSLLVLATLMVLAARWLRTLPEVQSFIMDFPGTPSFPESTPNGIPGWLGWQHFFNMFFLVLIIRTGLQVRHENRAPAQFLPKKNSLFAPKGSTPKKVSLSQWLHQALDIFWVLNGVVFVVLLFATAQWLRIVPTSWDVIPHALSAGLQYASLDWPQESSWVHYNALQMLAYTTTIFLAAPLAVISGIRFSTWWPDTNEKLSKLYPVELARAVHYPVMLYFVAFTLVHVLLVFLTGTLRNLNQMYTSRDAADWLGLGVFLVSLLFVLGGWFLTKPLFMRPVAQRFGTLTK